MVSIQELTHYLVQLLEPQLFKDYCPNGLQVAGKSVVKMLVTGVTASQTLLDRAIELQADAILVHHGYFWRNEDACIVGIKQQRIRKLLLNDINLLAYHLPLDAHAVYGNNVTLAQRLELEVERHYAVDGIPGLLWTGSLSQAMNGADFAEHICRKLHRTPLHISAAKPLINKVAWCTGAAQNFISHAIAHGVDAYITGEVSEQTVYLAKEAGMHFYAAGHHATERYGVQALGAHLAHYFGIEHHYVELDNPV